MYTYIYIYIRHPIHSPMLPSMGASLRPLTMPPKRTRWTPPCGCLVSSRRGTCLMGMAWKSPIYQWYIKNLHKPLLMNMIDELNIIDEYYWWHYWWILLMNIIDEYYWWILRKFHDQCFSMFFNVPLGNSSSKIHVPPFIDDFPMQKSPLLEMFPEQKL